MQTVSQGFKKAIKSDNREIYGYVEVNFDKQDGEYTVDSMPNTLVLSKQDGSDLLDDVKVMKNYATLENNYFSLDGSFMLANKSTFGDSGGYTSDDVFSDITTPIITIISEQDGAITTKGFTIFFKDNIPFEFDITIVDNNNNTTVVNVTDNDKHNYQHIFENEITITSMTLNILLTEFADRRIRIPEISLALTDVYKGDELVGFDVKEEIDLLLEELPINTCSVNLNNYADENGNLKFDPLNPSGLIEYLTDDTTIIPYIGVLTEDNGIEYVKMGTFYLKDWSSDADKNVTINGESLMGLLQNTSIPSDGNFLRTYFDNTNMARYLTENTGYQFHLESGSYYNIYLRDYNLLNWLKAVMPFQVMYYDPYFDYYYKRKFHITRDNIASQDSLDEYPVDSLSRSELLNDVKYETKSVINKVEIEDITTFNMSSTGKEDILVDTYTLRDTEEYVWYTLSKFTQYDTATFSYTRTGAGTATLIDKNYYMIYVRFTGNVGDTVTIKYNGWVFDDAPTKKNVFTSTLKNGNTLSLDFSKYFDANDSYLPTTAQFYLTNDKPYKVSVNTIGDPSLEAGDGVSIQTRYTDNEEEGYKDIVITKQHFTYDGGLTCELEGRGS